MAKPPILPSYYYLDHFTEMLAFVQQTYDSILAGDHHSFIACFDNLSRDARCLLIRMVNRCGAIFNRSLFNYPEINDIERATAELTAVGHARRLSERDYTAFVTCLPKDVLETGAQAAGEATSVSRGRSPSSSTTISSRSPSPSPHSTVVRTILLPWTARKRSSSRSISILERLRQP